MVSSERGGCDLERDIVMSSYRRELFSLDWFCFRFGGWSKSLLFENWRTRQRCHRRVIGFQWLVTDSKCLKSKEKTRERIKFNSGGLLLQSGRPKECGAYLYFDSSTPKCYLHVEKWDERFCWWCWWPLSECPKTDLGRGNDWIFERKDTKTLL